MKKILILLICLFVCINAYAQSGRSTTDIQNDVWVENESAIRVSSDAGNVLRDAWQDSYNTLKVSADVSVPKSIITGQLTIDAAATGTAVVLTADTAAVTEIQVIPLLGNTAQVYIGSSAARPLSTEGFRLTADTATIIRVDSTDDVYMDADVAGEGISWIGIVR